MDKTFPQASQGLSVSVPSNRASWGDFIELTKPGINLSNLIAVFTGYWLATSGNIQGWTLGFTLLGAALVIAGGCICNNVIDRDIDPLMFRTSERAVACGRISVALALTIAIGMTITGLIVLWKCAHPLAALLALLGFVVYVGIYSAWLKRTHWSNTIIGGMAGAVPPMIGYAADAGKLDGVAWGLCLLLLLWQPPHFYALSMRRVKEYRQAGIPMLPVIKGFLSTKRQILLFVILLWLASLMMAWSTALGSFYLGGALVLGGIYLFLASKGFFTQETSKWARVMFRYSLYYLLGIFITIIIDVL
ncbi:heme o synthase [Mechercharimyces sp. CAU 1602]|uniref:heme o synthase n=1 Tax=Mechercharimyces sp. CAU 1602 TaxID=2973933 RepID=UPI0021621BAA|nr:heme o synthase [Mechercharimyces sp. CAU 1602]MCS1352760.1 heme o synthase [Mechercharimyces sp. CAU 1602]